MKIKLNAEQVKGTSLKEGTEVEIALDNLTESGNGLYSSKEAKNASQSLVDLFLKISDSYEYEFSDFGEFIAEEVVGLFESMTYGDYPEESAKEDFEEFMRTFLINAKM